MRSCRLVVLSLAAVAAAGLTPSSGGAQSATQGFADSWYWGVYGGATNFTTAAGSSNLRTNAPSIGVDWMLTRKSFALNIFADQTFFSTLSSIASPTGPAPLPVNISDMRRLGFSAMIFTPEYKAIKPYFGVGYSFNFISSAALRTCANCVTFPTQAAADSNQHAIVNAKAMGKVFGNVGVMYVWRRFAPFAQYTLMPTQGTSDWYLNGSGVTSIWTVGLRYNFGTSIEKW
ncbi:MAG TPA: hypothetical protein VF368_05970 [Gemmatimonadaceae bacterium]